MHHLKQIDGAVDVGVSEVFESTDTAHPVGTIIVDVAFRGYFKPVPREKIAAAIEEVVK